MALSCILPSISVHMPLDARPPQQNLIAFKERIEAPHHWLCERNPPLTGEFPVQRASNAENVSILMTSSCISVHMPLDERPLQHDIIVFPCFTKLKL